MSDEIISSSGMKADPESAVRLSLPIEADRELLNAICDAAKSVGTKVAYYRVAETLFWIDQLETHGVAMIRDLPHELLADIACRGYQHALVLASIGEELQRRNERPGKRPGT